MKLWIWLLPVLLLAGCSSPEEDRQEAAKHPPPPLVVGESESHRTLRLQLGQVMTIRLKANPTTGYNWKFFLTDKSGVVSAVAFVGEEFVAGDSALVGAPGHTEYRVRGTAPGFVDIDGYYYRPWEKLDRKNDAQVHYRIVVE